MPGDYFYSSSQIKLLGRASSFHCFDKETLIMLKSSHSTMQWTIVLLPLLTISLILSGCTSTMSLDEAKKISLAVDERAYVMPSRHITDVLDVLNRSGQFDARATRQMKAQISIAPPGDADDGMLSRFYQKRGEAAWQLGYMKQALGDLRLAQSYAEKTGRNHLQLLTSLAVVESGAGNFQRAFELFEELFLLREDSVSVYHMVDAYIQMGDLETAEKISREGPDLSLGKTRKTGKRKQPKKFMRTDIREVHQHRIQYAILEAQGRHAEAEVHLRRELDLHHDKSVVEKIPRFAILNRNLLCINLLRQNRLLDAEIEARQALMESLGHGGVESDLTARGVETLARVLMVQGRLNDAEQLSRAGIRILEASGIPADSNIMCYARMLLGDILTRKRNFFEAMKQYDMARSGMEENRYLYEMKFARSRDLMLSLLKTGRFDEAMQIISRVHASYLKSFGETHIEANRLLGLRAMANAGLGRNREAFHDFSAAAAVLMEEGAKGRDRTDRLTRVILEAYIDFLGSLYSTPMETEVGVAAATESFRIVSYLGGESTQTALGESSARAAASYDPDLSDLVRREQDIQKQITALQNVFSNALLTPAEEQDVKVLKTLRTNIETLTKARTSLLDEIIGRFPRYADFTNPRSLSMGVIRGHLQSGETLVSIFTTLEKSYIWAIPQRGMEKFAVASLGRRELNRIILQLRKSLDAAPRTYGDIPLFDLGLAYKLYEILLKPVESAWTDSQGLLVAVHGPLDQLPLSLLPTAPSQPIEELGALFVGYRKVPWLIRTASLTMLPSVNALVTLRSLPDGDPQRRALAGFGDPIFNLAQLSEERTSTAAPMTKKEQSPVAGPHVSIQSRGVRVTAKGDLDNQNLNTVRLENLDRLPDTGDELRSIAETVGADSSRDLFLGKDCSEDKVKTLNLANRKVLAFATHALIPGDLDGLDQPALALSSPAVTAEREDGLLTMNEILKLKLNADWVVLSACNSGAAMGQGAEAVSGLGKAFFYAGTRALLVSMWPVETSSAKKLVAGIFRAAEVDKTLSRAQAMKISMLNLIDRDAMKDEATGRVVAGYAHPFFWAPFVMVGDPGKDKKGPLTSGK
jgi:CHAT domain-containing protein